MSLWCKVREIDRSGKRVLLSDDSVFGENMMRTAYTIMGYGVAFNAREYDHLRQDSEEGTVEGTLKAARDLIAGLPKILDIRPTA